MGALLGKREGGSDGGKGEARQQRGGGMVARLKEEEEEGNYTAHSRFPHHTRRLLGENIS